MLNVSQLTCRRGGRRVFRAVSFTVQAGEVMFVTGANGSGKSTLLRALAGLVPCAAGEVHWHDTLCDVASAEHRARLNYIGHLDAVKSELTVAEILSYWSVLAGADIAASLHDDPFSVMVLKDRPIRLLSAGQRRRLSLTRLMLRHAPLWLLDEPTTALDDQGQKILNNMLTRHRATGGIALMAAHQDVDMQDVKKFSMPASVSGDSP